jgi:hypothetical protein
LRYETQHSSNAHASFATKPTHLMNREETIKKIFEAWDIHELIDMQVLATRAELVRVMTLAQDDLTQRYGGVLSRESVAKLAVLHNEWAKAIADIFSVEQLTDWYITAYTREMTDDELTYILAHYSSPIGQKIVRAEQKALAHMTGEMLFQKKLRGDPMFTSFCSEVQRVMIEQSED